jgi:bile acid:Na+ symporter, BASS family
MGDYSYIDILINAVLAIIMLGIGLSLTMKDFRNIFIHPRSLLTALGAQLLVIPAVAFAIAAFSGLPAPMKVGMVIVSVCASGASSNLISHLLKGNVALAISMTTINSLITLVSVPLMVNLALITFLGVQKEISLPFWETVFQIFIVTVLPAFLGILIRRYRPVLALRLEKPLKFILPTLLATVFTIKVFLGESSGGTGISLNETLYLFPPLVILNVLAMTAGFLSGRIMRIPFQDQYTIPVEVGLHNTALALLISGTILQNAEMEKPAVVYAMFSFFTAILFVLAIKRIFAPKEKKNPPSAPNA